MALHNSNLQKVPHASAIDPKQRSLVSIDNRKGSQEEPRQSGPQSPLSTWLASEQLMEQELASFDGPSSAPQELTSGVTTEARHNQTRMNVLVQKQSEHRAAHKEKKQRLRRSRILQADEVLDEEPTYVSPFNTLPDFEYLEIAEPSETPSGLAGFGNLGVFSHETMADPSPNAPTSNQLLTNEPLENVASSTDRGLSFAAGAGTLRQMEDDSIMNMNSGINSLSLNERRPTMASHTPINSNQVSPDNFQVPPDQLACYCPTCPIPDFHTVGPYYHKAILGDQNHVYFKGSNPPPEVWLAYERSLRSVHF